MSNNSNTPFKQSVAQNTRNRQTIFDHQTAQPRQSELLQETANFNGLPPPPSHYARFQNFKQLANNEPAFQRAPIQSAYEITMVGKPITDSLSTIDN